MSPQLAFLNTHGLLSPLRSLILANLSSEPQTSHQLKQAVRHNQTYLALTRLLSNYQLSGFSEPASFIGAVGSDLAHKKLCRHCKSYCPHKHCQEDAFKSLGKEGKMND